MTDGILRVIRCGEQNAHELLTELRRKLSPQGDVVSEAGRQRTIDLFGEALSPRHVVQRICVDVRQRGLSAVLDYTCKLDRKELTRESMRVSPGELQAAHAQANPAYLATIRRIRDNIAEFQSHILHRDQTLSRINGSSEVTLTQRYLPLRRVGVCVPGGAAAYPSTVLMTVVPAKTAGVREIAVVVPPTEFGGYHPGMLAVCHELGVTEVYRIGGAQAVAALAYGVAGIPRVDKIVGPGNLFVALAKQHVYGEVDIDSIAGPSEVVVLADASANPAYVASDLISQAEHSPGASVLITWRPDLVPQTVAALESQLATLERGDLARASLKDYGAVLVARSLEEACELTDDLAPEHLHLSLANPRDALQRIQNAGAIFIGHHTPVAVGDYFAGPSHVLPTGGTARFANGLCANDFLKRSSLIEYNPAALQDAAADIVRLAEMEGLTGHARSVTIRTGQ